jgi:hypothetical protein
VGRFFDENINDEKAHVVMESSSVWYNIYNYLSEEKHLNVVLSNPVKTRLLHLDNPVCAYTGLPESIRW